LARLNKTRNEKQNELDILQAEADRLSRKLHAADKLITGLASEQKRWS